MSNSSNESSQAVYCLLPHVTIEHFDDGALLLRSDTRVSVELNTTGQFILEHTDGTRTASQVAHELTRAFPIAHDEALADVIALYENLSSQNIVRLGKLHEESSLGGNTMSEPRYIRNPDVGLREESEDGGLLYNPDTNQVQVVNSTGLLIWKLCDGNHTVDEMISAILEEYEGAPVDEVTADVRTFVDNMILSGFFGTVESMGLASGVNHG